MQTGPSDGAPQDPVPDLVTRTRSGDTHALQDLLVRYLPELHAFCRLNMGEHLEARESTEDVVQSSCREVLQSLENFEYLGVAQFRRWLFLHVLRKIQQRGRYWKAAKRAAVAVPLDASASWAAYASVASPSEAAMSQEEVAKIEKAFHVLSDDQRRALTMAKFLHMTSEEIGEQLGKPAGSVRVMLHRALAKLTVVLDAQS